MSQLNIYRASAGSGKTYELVLQYLIRVFGNPRSYRSILAVTFTNKAADEMKSRIFTVLHDLENQPEKSPYLARLQAALNREADWISLQAGKIKQLMLHDYSRISVQTIDRFFQGVLRTFARESGLSPGFQLELDQGKVLGRFSQWVFDQAGQNPSIRNWLVDWITERMENGEKWMKLETDLIKTGHELLKEEVLGYLAGGDSNSLSEAGITTLRNQARRVIHNYKAQMEALKLQSIKVLDDNGLTVDDFKNKNSGPAGFLTRLNAQWTPAPRAIQSLDQEDQWVVKNHVKRSQILANAYPELNQIMHRAVDLVASEGKDYVTAVAINQNLFALWFANNLIKFLGESAARDNELLLSFTQPLIRTIIGNNPTPFIFERTGTFIQHYLIDEFQDTSDLQWKNFLPLLEDSLSEDGFVMVVGDVKQSLYRWRNSNWKLIGRKAETDLRNFGSVRKPLNVNFRSGRAIVEFNNALFEKITNSYAEKESVPLIPEVYSDVKQDPGNYSVGEGYVQIHYLEGAKEREWKREVAAKLPQMVEDLLVNRGYRQTDILFLVRSNKEADEISQMLTRYLSINPDSPGNRKENPWSFVSPDVFRLGASAVVRILLGAFEYLSTGDPYQIDIMSWELEILRKPDQVPQPDLDHQRRNILTGILDPLKSLDPVNALDTLARILELESFTDHLPYLHQFRDLVRKFTLQYSGHFTGFLEWWEVSGAKANLVTASETDAMQIMTIHKAKGLSSPVVIIPFCSWPLDHKPNLGPWLWADTQGTPFDSLPRIPVRYSSSLDKSWFAEAYQMEKNEACLDSLNLLYVAFTRAEDILIAMCPGKTTRQTVASSLQVIRTEDQPTLIFGDPDQRNSRKPALTTPDYLTFPAGSESPGFLVPAMDFDSPETLFGKAVHAILQEIRDPGQTEKMIEKVWEKREGDYLDKEHLRSVLASIWEFPQMSDWFSGEWEVLTEAAILVPQQGDRRPDRIMIRGNEAVVLDYKTGSPEAKHFQQVRSYMALLGKMGYQPVSGYLLYFQPAGLIQVTDQEG